MGFFEVDGFSALGLFTVKYSEKFQTPSLPTCKSPGTTRNGCPDHPSKNLNYVVD